MCNTREHLTASSGIVVEWMKNFLSLFLLLVATLSILLSVFLFPSSRVYCCCCRFSRSLSLSFIFFCFFGYSFFSSDTFRHPHSPSLWLEGFQAVERENVLRFFVISREILSNLPKKIVWKMTFKNLTRIYGKFSEI